MGSAVDHEEVVVGSADSDSDEAETDEVETDEICPQPSCSRPRASSSSAAVGGSGAGFKTGHFVINLDSDDSDSENRETELVTGKSSGRTKSDKSRTTLIVCPLSVVGTWVDQFERHVDENVHLSLYIFYGPTRTKKSKELAEHDVVITTYSTLVSDGKMEKSVLQQVDWLRVVLDEGHTIRNKNAQMSKLASQLKAERRWILSGTPVQNNIMDLFSLIRFLHLPPLNEVEWFRRLIAKPLSSGDTDNLSHLVSVTALRRLKNQKIKGKPVVELPSRSVFQETVKLSDEERGIYDAVMKEGRVIAGKYFQEGTLLQHYGEILAILVRLRQLCCHPFLLQNALSAVSQAAAAANPEERDALIKQLVEVLNSGSDEECAICLQSLVHPIITQCAHVFCKGCIQRVLDTPVVNSQCPLCRADLDGRELVEVPRRNEEASPDGAKSSKVTSDEWQSSTKIDALMHSLLKLREKDSSVKSVIVSQFTSFLDLIEIPLKSNGFRFTRLDGTMNAKQRAANIELFMDLDPRTPTVFLLSLKAGGVGISLTAANHIFLMEPAWNPAAEEQCFDRCHRLGQTKDVSIVKFITDDSVETDMLELQERKRGLMADAFGSKEDAEKRRAQRLDDLKKLFRLK